MPFGAASGPVGNFGHPKTPFEPETTGLEGQCYILAKPPAHLAFGLDDALLY